MPWSNFLQRNKENKNFVEKENIYINSNAVVQKARWTIALSGLKTNYICWRQQQISMPRKTMKGLIWNMSMTNMHRS